MLPWQLDRQGVQRSSSTQEGKADARSLLRQPVGGVSERQVAPAGHPELQRDGHARGLPPSAVRPRLPCYRLSFCGPRLFVGCVSAIPTMPVSRRTPRAAARAHHNCAWQCAPVCRTPRAPTHHMHAPMRQARMARRGGCKHTHTHTHTIGGWERRGATTGRVCGSARLLSRGGRAALCGGCRRDGRCKSNCARHT